jgi:hypothetical protein
MLEHFAVAFAAHAAFSGIEAALKYVAKKRPDLEAAAQKAAASNNPREIDKVFQEAIGVIIAEAASGAINVDGATIAALRGVKFDHQHGTVTIGNTTVSASVLVTGGSAGATGKTEIGGNTKLSTKGTSIEIGQGASITITGGARIEQT